MIVTVDAAKEVLEERTRTVGVRIKNENLTGGAAPRHNIMVTRKKTERNYTPIKSMQHFAEKIAQNNFCCEIKFTDNKVNNYNVQRYFDALNKMIFADASFKSAFANHTKGSFIRVNDSVFVIKYF